MTAQLFSEAMNEISEKYVAEALSYERPAKKLLSARVKRWAAACLALALGLGTLLAVSPDARAEVRRWFAYWQDDQLTYRYDGGALEGGMPYYGLSALPEGYVMDTEDSIYWSGIVSIVYRSETEPEKDPVIFDYHHMDDGTAFSIIVAEGETVRDVTVNGLSGKLYLPREEGSGTLLEWIDVERELHFSIDAWGFGADELIAMAESMVQLEEKPAFTEHESEPIPLDELEGERLTEEDFG